jgi:Zn-dependent protease
VRETLILFGCLVVAVILHEISHGVAAFWFGDDTAKRAGRLTLNPVPHIDPFGSIILPAMGALAGLPIFGYAKPVPVNASRMRHPRRDIVFVSLAGPACNLTLMAVAAVTTRWLLHGGSGLASTFDGHNTNLLVEIVFYFALVNLLLGLFNLLPIPPLDGSRVMTWLLPASLREPYRGLERFGLLIVIGLLVFVPAVNYLIQDTVHMMLGWVDAITSLGGVW